MAIELTNDILQRLVALDDKVHIDKLLFFVRKK